MVAGNQPCSQAQTSDRGVTARINIHIYNSILEHSKAKGSGLAMLLVLAKFSDDSGLAWPSVKMLAKLVHLTERGAQFALRKLVAQGELEISPGPNRSTSRYRIVCVRGIAKKQAVQGEKPNARQVKRVSPEQERHKSSHKTVPFSPHLKNQGGEVKQYSNREEHAKPKPPAVSPPIVQQQAGFGYTDEQRAEWARAFYNIVPRQAYELRLPLDKSQVRNLRNVMTLKMLPYPKPGSWLAKQMQRPI